jgi:hypothetical protein
MAMGTSTDPDGGSPILMLRRADQRLEPALEERKSNTRQIKVTGYTIQNTESRIHNTYSISPLTYGVRREYHGVGIHVSPVQDILMMIVTLNGGNSVTDRSTQEITEEISSRIEGSKYLEAELGSGGGSHLEALLLLLPELLLLQFVGGGLLRTSHAALTGNHEVLDGHNLAEGGAKGHHERVEVGGSAFPLVPLEPGKKTIN